MTLICPSCKSDLDIEAHQPGCGARIGTTRPMTTPSELRMALIRITKSDIEDTDWHNAVEDLLHLIVDRLEPAPEPKWETAHNLIRQLGGDPSKLCEHCGQAKIGELHICPDSDTSEPAPGGESVFSTAPQGTLPESTGTASPPVRWRCEKCGMEWDHEPKPRHLVMDSTLSINGCPGPVLPLNPERTQ